MLTERYNLIKGKAIRMNNKFEEKTETNNLYTQALLNYAKNIEGLEEEKIVQYKAQTAIKAIIDKVSQSHISHVKDLVTYGLQTIFFDHNYSLDIEVRDLRGNKALEFKLLEEMSDGTTVLSPFEDGIGGGIKSVVGLILQIYHIQYYNLYPILFMDEALSNISSQYIPTTMEFLESKWQRRKTLSLS